MSFDVRISLLIYFLKLHYFLSYVGRWQIVWAKGLTLMLLVADLANGK